MSKPRLLATGCRICGCFRSESTPKNTTPKFAVSERKCAACGLNCGKPSLLDLFSGAGGAARGYQLAGFCVLGVDVKPQPRYAGCRFHQGDALTFPLDGFDVIHASPPCQAHSTLAVMWNANRHEDLIIPIRNRLRQSGLPYVIENVPGAPLIDPIQLCGSSFGLGTEVYDGWRQLRRHRLFESSFWMLRPTCDHRGATIGIYGDHARDRRRKAGERDRGTDFPRGKQVDLGRQAMDMPWVAHWRELSQAIPPAYTRFIGEQAMRLISAERMNASA